MKTKRGRPKLPKGEARSEIVQVRLTKAEKAAVAEKAKSAGFDISEWIRLSITGDSASR
jgi:hypothetical protein